jgi:hypothetical protein
MERDRKWWCSFSHATLAAAYCGARVC